MPLSRTANIVIGVGVGVAAVVGVVVWSKRRARAQRVAESAALAVAKEKAAEGLQVPPGANALVKAGVALINLGKITKYEMEALFQALQALNVSPVLIGQITEYFKAKQPSEHAIWNKERDAKRGQWQGMVKAAAKRLSK